MIVTSRGPCGIDQTGTPSDDDERCDQVEAGCYLDSKEAGKEVRAGGRLCLIPSLGVLIILLSGCCWLSKRSCFPTCPPPTRVVVEVEKTCELPPQLVLEAVKRSACPTQSTWACFEPVEGGKLAKNLADLKTWIREARARCGPKPASQPTSQPSQ